MGPEICDGRAPCHRLAIRRLVATGSNFDLRPRFAVDPNEGSLGNSSEGDIGWRAQQNDSVEAIIDGVSRDHADRRTTLSEALLNDSLTP